MQSLFLFIVGKLLCVIISINQNSTPVSTGRFIFATILCIPDVLYIELRKRLGSRSAALRSGGGEIDSWLKDPIYLHVGFRKIFVERSGPSKDGLYPTISVRQLMWALKMKLFQKNRWETAFDRQDI